MFSLEVKQPLVDHLYRSDIYLLRDAFACVNSFLYKVSLHDQFSALLTKLLPACSKSLVRIQQRPQVLVLHQREPTIEKTALIMFVL